MLRYREAGGFKEESCYLHVLVIGIHTLYEGDADEEILVLLCQVTDVLKDLFIRYSKYTADASQNPSSFRSTRKSSVPCITAFSTVSCDAYNRNRVLRAASKQKLNGVCKIFTLCPAISVEKAGKAYYNSKVTE